MPISIDPPVGHPLPPPLEDGSFLWELLYEPMGYLRRLDEEEGTPHHNHLRMFLEGECEPLQPLYDLLRERSDGTPPYGILYDPQRCPAEQLPFLAMHVGAILTPDMNEAQRRAEIEQPTTWRRGQKANKSEALKLPIRKTLATSDGSPGRVIVRERTPGPADLYVRTLKEETPDPGLTERVAAEHKVAGLVLDYEAIDGVTWADIAAAFEDWGEVEDTFTSWADLADTLPDELPEP
ncbi:MAG TPA: phage tail protein [Solirubrobacterales bacterium]|nr:phage tail protein [Solirubrobacterales bacterium]